MIVALAMGLAGGILSGLLGVGGGILFVPALTLVLSLKQVRAESTSLLAIVPVALVGATRQYRYGNVKLRDAGVVGALSVLGVVAGVVLANVLSQRVLKLAFAAVLASVSIQFVRRFWQARASGSG